MSERLVRRLQIIRYVALAVIVGAGFLANGGTRAYASSQPPTAYSFYVRTTNVGTLQTLGCNQGKTDKADGRNSEVVLDFGVQWSNNSEVELTGTSTLISYATVENLAEQFAFEYWNCTGSDQTTVMRLGIGTNNSTPYESSTLGNGWAQVATTVLNWLTNYGFEYYGQEDIWGANDIEPGFGGSSSQTNAENWANGYSGYGHTSYLDYGSADGCPPYGSCNNGWSQYGEYYVSWGDVAAFPLPEIYYTANATQWASISSYALHSLGSTMIFQGPLDEYDLNTGTLTASGAWSALGSALSSAGVNSSLTYSDEIHIAS